MDALRCLNQLVPDTLSAQSSSGSTPAHAAAAKGHVDALRCLRQLAPNTLTAEDNSGHPPAAYATDDVHTMAALEYLDACQVLTPLMLAAADRLHTVANELLHNGADPTVARVYQGSRLTALLTKICHKPLVGA